MTTDIVERIQAGLTNFNAAYEGDSAERERGAAVELEGLLIDALDELKAMRANPRYSVVDEATGLWAEAQITYEGFIMDWYYEGDGPPGDDAPYKTLCLAWDQLEELAQ